MIGHPWPGQTLVEAWLGAQAERLEGWQLDTVVAEFAAAGCRIDAATGQRIMRLTAAMPLYVQNAVQLTQNNYQCAAEHFCAALEERTHIAATAQELILSEAFDGLSVSARSAAAVLGLADVPLTTREALELLVTEIGEAQAVAAALRELTSHGLVQEFYGGRLTLHDAFRPLARGQLQMLGEEVADRSRNTLCDLLFRSLPEERDMGRVGLWIRLLAATDRIDVLIDLATREWFHEIGDQSDIKDLLEAAANSVDLPPEDRFWALDALVFWDYLDDEEEATLDRVQRMADLVDTSQLGARERISFRMKQMLLAARNADRGGVEAAFEQAITDARSDQGFQRVVRYNRANALYLLGDYAEAAESSMLLAEDYYDHLGLQPDDVFAKSQQEIAALLKHTPTQEDDLKHLADCLDLYTMSQHKRGESSDIARIHAMKFYAMAGAWRSTVRAGQDVVDELLDLGDPQGSRNVMEDHILPIVRRFEITDLLVTARGQYAVVLAWCGELEMAREEMSALNHYEITAEQQRELQGQRVLIENIAASSHQPPPH